MVNSISLLSLGATIVGISLAWFTARRAHPLSRKQRFFVGLNLSTALWCLGEFLLVNYAPGKAAGTFGYRDPGYAITMVIALGVVGSAFFWFLFGAEHGGRRSWAKGGALWMASLPGVYTLLAVATNPSHGLLTTQAAAHGPVVSGPLSPGYLVGIYSLVILGALNLIRGSRGRGNHDGRRQALLLAGATLMPLLGGILWQLREYLPVVIDVNPVPSLFALLQLVIVHEVVVGGLADLIPHARAAAFDAMHDAAIVLDPQLRVVTLNRAASRIFPMVEEGAPIDEYFATLGQHARTCLERHPEGVNFEADLGGSVYWGRVRQPAGRNAGCLILLTDLTDLRSAQAELMRLGVGPRPANLHLKVMGERQGVEV